MFQDDDMSTLLMFQEAYMSTLLMFQEAYMRTLLCVFGFLRGFCDKNHFLLSNYCLSQKPPIKNVQK